MRHLHPAGFTQSRPTFQERNYRLFYNVLLEYIEELLPVACFPTVARACQKYGLIFRRPRGLFITLADRGRIHQLLTNWPETRVKVPHPSFPSRAQSCTIGFVTAALSCSELSVWLCRRP